MTILAAITVKLLPLLAPPPHHDMLVRNETYRVFDIVTIDVRLIAHAATGVGSTLGVSSTLGASDSTGAAGSMCSLAG
jgi:hypothetical protein